MSKKEMTNEEVIAKLLWARYRIDSITYAPDVLEAIDIAISRVGVNEEQGFRDFTEWVATEIFDDMWEYNKDAFAEIACRKLAKLGIVRAKGDEWVLVEPKESEDEG